MNFEEAINQLRENQEHITDALNKVIDAVHKLSQIVATLQTDDNARRPRDPGPIETCVVDIL